MPAMYTKFKLPNSIGFGDIERVPKYQNGGCSSPQTPLVDKFFESQYS